MSRKTRKLIWSVPLIAAVAVIGALAAFMTLEPNQASAQADQPPGKVGMLTAVAYDDGVPQEEIELTWDAPTMGGLASHYRIDISTNGGYTWVALEDSIRNTRHLHDDLKANQTFHYRVFAVNSIGASPVSDVATATTTETDVPDRPTNLAAAVGDDANTDLQATTAEELTVTLMWDPPQDPPGAPILGYIIEYSDDGNRWIELMTVDDEGDGQQTATHAMLDAGIEYHYRVAAYNKTMKNADDEDVPNSSFTSGWSETDDAETLKGAMPATPTPLEPGVSPAVTGVWLYWTPPTNTTATPNADPMGDPITAYEVEGRPTQRFNDADPPALVDCADSAGNCPFQVIKTDIDRPSGSVINNFLVTARDVNANTDYDDDFDVDIPWAYRIRAINRRANDEAETAAGTGADATTAQGLITTSKSAVIEVPARTNTSLTRPENLVITRSEPDNEGRTGLLLRWNRAETLPYDADSDPATPNAVTFAAAYRIEYSDDGPPDAAYDWKLLVAAHPAVADAAQQRFIDNHLALDVGTPTATENDLRAGQERHYRVFALVGANAGDEMSWPSEQKSGTTAAPIKPERPTNLSARAGDPAGHTSIDLTWTPPDMPVATNDDLDGSEEGPSVIKGYRVQYSDDEGKTWADLVKDRSGDLMLVEGTKYTDTGLMPGQTRDYRVAAANMVGSRYQYSTWSNSDSAKTTPAPLPNEPGGLVAEADGHNAIKLCWNAQAEQPEAAPVTSYKIEYSPDGKDGTWKELATVDMETDDQIHTVYRDTMGLSAETTRHYRVSATNLRGDSDQSDTAMATTGPAPPNTDPMAVGSIPAVTVTAGEMSEAITLGDYFSDADGDPLMYTAMSDMEMYATAEIAINDDDPNVTIHTLTITGVAEGSATITVTASDDMGGMDAEQTFMVTVESANMAPMAGAAIADQTVTAGEMVMVQSTITDPDAGDTLSWEAESDMPMYATATVDNMGMVTITGVAAGMATITVTATDMEGESASQDIMVTVMAVRMAPANVRFNIIGSGFVNVDWEPVPGAHGYYIMAAENRSGGEVHSAVVNGGDSNLGAIGGLTKDVEYLLYVGAFFTLEEYVLEYQATITAE